MGILKSLFNLITSFFNWKSSGVAQDRMTRKDKIKREKAVDTDIEKGQQAVRDEDMDEINRRMQKLSAVMVTSAILLISSGCISSKPAVVYIPESARIIAMDYGDPPVHGFFVPKERFALLLEMSERWKAHVESERK